MKTKPTIAGLFFLGACALLADTAETIPFVTTMLPANETPPITDTSTGNAIIWVHVIRDASGVITSGSVDFDITTRFSSAVTVTGLHIHNGPAGVAAGIVIPTDVNGGDKKIDIDAAGRARIQKQVQFPQTTPSITVATIQDLINNPQGFYVNIHTTDHGSGAMRGQLLRAEMKVLMGLMSSANEVPPVTTNASAVATVTVLRARDSSGNVAVADAIFNAEYTGVDSVSGTTFTGFHIHKQVAGVNGSVILNTGIGGGANSVAADPSGTGNLNYVVAVAAQDPTFVAEVDAINGLFDNPSGFYINLHSTVFGNGFIRDQMRNTDSNTLQVALSPSNEVPPIANLNATGTTAVSVYTLRNADGTVAAGTVIFDVNFRNFPAPTTITGLHIHSAAAGVNGGIVIPTNVGGGAASVVTDSGNGNIFKTVTVATSAGIAALNNIVQNPALFYENLHTTVNGGGAMRSQLSGPAAKPNVGGVAATSSTILTAAPGSILSIYGADLATYTSDLSGLPRGVTALPTSMNGVTATIANVKSPFYFISPGQLNIQVPFEVAAGTQPLVVTTAGGASASFNITVATVAPSIFIVDQPTNLGAVVKNVDFSLITASNPAKAGEVIVIYSTGLGQTTPALQTGSLQGSSSGFNNTGPVSVTIGGKDAAFVYSIAAPGFAGLYQTAVTVPSGVSGTVPLILKAGTASSNSVSVTVQ
jgi:uncharacterized protein (TIGR03437 family)